MAATGIGCILWGYYQLFAVTLEKALIDKTVTALTVQGEKTGRAVAFRPGMVVILRDKAVEEFPERSIVKVGSTTLFDFETRRAVSAACISSAGGIAVWVALFFF